MKKVIAIAISLFSVWAVADSGNTISVNMRAVNEKGPQESIGHITVEEAEGGVVFSPSLKGLAEGSHGFHIHENPSCESSMEKGKLTAAGTAGSHLDPGNEHSHKAPWENGHMGDLPALHFESDQSSHLPVFKADITLMEVRGRALIIHKNSDNYSDEPKPSGGGGDRVACGVIEK